MSNGLTALTNMILPAILAIVAGFFWSWGSALAIMVIYLIGGAVTLLFIEKQGGEHPSVVFTGWYVGPMMGILGS